MQEELRRSNRISRHAIPDDFTVYLLEVDVFDVGDPVNFDEATIKAVG